MNKGNIMATLPHVGRESWTDTAFLHTNKKLSQLVNASSVLYFLRNHFVVSVVPRQIVIVIVYAFRKAYIVFQSFFLLIRHRRKSKIPVSEMIRGKAHHE